MSSQCQCDSRELPAEVHGEPQELSGTDVVFVPPASSLSCNAAQRWWALGFIFTSPSFCPNRLCGNPAAFPQDLKEASDPHGALGKTWVGAGPPWLLILPLLILLLLLWMQQGESGHPRTACDAPGAVETTFLPPPSSFHPPFRGWFGTSCLPAPGASLPAVLAREPHSLGPLPARWAPFLFV